VWFFFGLCEFECLFPAVVYREREELGCAVDSGILLRLSVKESLGRKAQLGSDEYACCNQPVSSLFG
jgi:hypothetical protein